MSQIFKKPEHWYQPIDNTIRDRMDEFDSLRQEEKERLENAALLAANPTNYLCSETFDNTTWTRDKVK